MNKFFTVALLSALVYTAKAQNAPAPVQPFGKIDKADLDLKQCDFEKDANAEVLFDKGTVFFTDAEIIFERHIRIKIFNDNGKSAANVNFQYHSGGHYEWVEKLQAQTINDNNGKPEMTRVDKKQIFDKRIDKEISEISFAFPNVKAGSVIEYKYDISSNSAGDFPDWFFQGELPTHYSEIEAKIPDFFHYKHLTRVTQPYAVNLRDNYNQLSKIALANVPSIGEEPYFTCIKDNLQGIQTQLLSITPSASSGIFGQNFLESWNKVGQEMVDDESFGGQFNKKLTGEQDILSHAKSLKTNDQKIEYIFDQVKNNMKWNDEYAKFTDDGTAKAWDRKTGNYAEINLEVYHLLKKAGINAMPIITSTRKHGRINPAYPAIYPFNSVATYVPIDSANFYVLDATRKGNVYNVIPFYFLNSFGLAIDMENKKYDVAFIQNTVPSRNVVLLNANISTDGKMQGTAQINNFAYDRINNINSYKTDGEKKYTDYLRGDNNDLKISSLKMENMEADSLPLTQDINFNLDLSGSDGTYIYFKPNLFTSFGTNPFLNEKRMTDIDFGYLRNQTITGNYKIPAGYKVDAMPQGARMDMSDQSISFRRLIAENEGIVTVRYTIMFRKSILFKENYDELRAFYKKMYEMMNEQVVLKKG